MLALVPLGGHPGEAPPYPGGFFGQSETADVSVESLRFCIRVCRVDSVAYLRTPAGPLPGSDNPRAVVYMQPGARFSWTYRDQTCDVLGCGGHDLRLEDGTADGQPVGLVSADHQSLAWSVPADARPESVIRYFCARHAGAGMTGAFQVLPIRLLSLTPPHRR
jgi:hypothetical protein